MTHPISRLTSTFAIAGLLFMAPLMAMARMAAPTMPTLRAPIAHHAATPEHEARKSEAAEAEH
jgi:hypothetical protein